MSCWEGEQIEGPSDHQPKRHLHVTLTPARRAHFGDLHPGKTHGFDGEVNVRVSQVSKQLEMQGERERTCGCSRDFFTEG